MRALVSSLILFTLFSLAHFSYHYHDDLVPPWYHSLLPSQTTKRTPISYSKTYKQHKQPRYDSRRLLLRQKVDYSTQAHFPELFNFAAKASKTTIKEYPWIAWLIHANQYAEVKNFYPYLCTSSCIAEQIFITSGRCLMNIKINRTVTAYQNVRLFTKAFVLPSVRSRQMYDDVGLVVTFPGALYGKPWPLVPTYMGKRTDNEFKWFIDLKTGSQKYKVVAYATEKDNILWLEQNTSFVLQVLDVNVGVELCEKIYTPYHKVPCYMACSLGEFAKQDRKCMGYMGVIGGAVIDQNKKLFGVATWGVLRMSEEPYELPVGFAVPNGLSFLKDFGCATKIKSYPREDYVGWAQKLCNNNTIP